MGKDNPKPVAAQLPGTSMTRRFEAGGFASLQAIDRPQYHRSLTGRWRTGNGNQPNHESPLSLLPPRIEEHLRGVRFDLFEII
jgi:hypothetical protein